MDTTPDLDDTLVVYTLADAFGIGLELGDLFGRAGDFCAVWLGAADGTTHDFVVCTEDRGRDVDRLVMYATAVAPLVEADRAVVWRSADDLADGPALAAGFFDRRDLLDDAGVDLVDEIVLGDDELRSLAITTFTDEAGWDDVSDRVAVGDDEAGQ